ncbi:MAG: HDIG domain-containing protein [Patescibacteria group bacterium]|nr:HDIG domain-containing protein [Patescibacteria group bacterium]
MDLGVNYKQAEELLNKYIKDDIVKMHCLESEAIMRELAKHFNENEEIWGIIGLLHDIDWDLTKNNPKEHTVKAVEILKEAGASDFLIETIVSHGYGNEFCGINQDKARTAKIQHALAAAETLTGLIIACALVQPDKKLASVKPESLKKKFKTRAFAAKCDREIILECEKIGLSLDEFLEIGLKALQRISDKLGL